ncbi:hypothetical protein RFI_20484 [Reticulomyxa filosa]|uniref:Uncharacterized protein n=1 Tax=Reticulomyxa filosa TaxID=46433 RepID=X6MUT0_RETFI|nr:hypothetical protein RFI_20484 [Reticulomyxa filosa]|eukprot:ETO16855.1 hypothetical protein RFI_20484 [Reticulomyxa filosa]
MNLKAKFAKSCSYQFNSCAGKENYTTKEMQSVYTINIVTRRLQVFKNKARFKYKKGSFLIIMHFHLLNLESYTTVFDFFFCFFASIAKIQIMYKWYYCQHYLDGWYFICFFRLLYTYTYIFIYLFLKIKIIIYLFVYYNYHYFYFGIIDFIIVITNKEEDNGDDIEITKKESIKKHEQICPILINQLTPKYSEMILFMAGILYGNIENKKDPSGSGLLYFWKLLHSSPQAVPIYQVMLHMHCLDACKADINSSFLSRSLQTLIHSFKSLLIDWIKGLVKVNAMFTISLDNVMKLYLPNFQYLLHHSDIHLCVINQIKVIQTQLSKIDNNQLL